MGDRKIEIHYHHRSRRTSAVDALAGLLLVGLIVLAAVIYVLIAVVKFLFAIRLFLAAALALTGLYFAVSEISKFVTRQRVVRYLSLAPDAIDGKLDATTRAEFVKLARNIARDEPARRIGEEGVYEELVGKYLADGWVSDDEAQKLAVAERLFDLDQETALTIKRWAFHGLITWLGDNLTPDRETSLRTVALRLGLPSWEVDERLGKLSLDRALAQRAARAEHDASTRAEQAEWDRVLADARERADALAVLDVEQRSSVDVSIRLRKGERCWYTSPCALLERGQAKRPGTMFVTNERLIFMDGGAVTLRMPAILDVAADPETDMLRVVADGQKTPFELEIAEPLVALAHIERSLAELPDAG